MHIFMENHNSDGANYMRPSWEKPKKYGFLHFIWDLVLVGLTGGLWLIWIFVREMRKRG